MNDTIIKIEDVSKQYRLGLIGGGTLQGDLQSWWAKIRGKEDPNSKIGSKTYAKNEKFLALDGINLEVKRGERVGIIGHNGAGKSTLLKLLSRVTAPTTGKICLDGRISSMLEVGTGFHGELTGRENIYLNGAILGMSREEVTAKIDKIIEFSECGQFIDTPVKRYSSGMYVKLAFSVAAHLDSEILIMDEVLAVGDMAFQQKCIDKMSEVSRSEGRTILYVSHNMATIRKLCDRCVVLEHGKLIYDGDVEEAIDYYSKNDFEAVLQKDLSQYKRTSLVNGDVLMLSAKYIDKDSPTFASGEKMKFTLTWQNNVNVENVGVRIEISRDSGTPIATTMLENVYSGKAGETASADIEVDIGGIVPGKYNALYVLYRKDSNFGNSIDLDFVDGLSFIVDNDNDITWNYNSWGNVRLSPLNVTVVK